jgi:hypothetical protein
MDGLLRQYVHKQLQQSVSAQSPSRNFSFDQGGLMVLLFVFIQPSP